MDADSELIPRSDLIDGFKISDSCERRRRKDGADWPPHLLIGRKVYYRRQSVSDWLRQRESAKQAVNLTDDTEALTVVLRQTKVLTHAAPPLTAEQALDLRNLLAKEPGVSEQ